MISSLLYLNILLLLSVSVQDVECTVYWNSFSNTSSLSESHDGSYTLDGFSASCYLYWLDCSSVNLFLRIACPYANETKACSCTISSNPASGLFYLSGNSSWYYLMKSSCSSSNGCASAGSYSIDISCSASNSYDNTSSTRTHTVTFTEETLSSKDQEDSDAIGPIVGGAVGAVGLCAVVTVGIYTTLKIKKPKIQKIHPTPANTAIKAKDMAIKNGGYTV